MPLEFLTDLNQTTFHAQIENCRFILFSPRSPSRNALLAWFIGANVPTAYYALTPQDRELRGLLTNLVQSVQDVDPLFGRQTSQAVVQPSIQTADLAEALVDDLAEAKPKLRFLILDEFDHLVVDEALEIFFAHLIARLPDGLQLIISSRQLPYQRWAHFVCSGEAVVLGTSSELDAGIFNSETIDSPQLEVYGFGKGKVYVNGLPVDSWDGPLSRNLFYYLIDHPLVTRDEIFATFWPTLPTKEATNVFHVTKRKIGERLGYEVTDYSGGFYRPSAQLRLHYDVVHFEAAVAAGRETPEPMTSDAWYKAIRLYRFPFLSNMEMPWIVKRREGLKLAYTEALVGIGRLHKAQGDTQRAISYYLRALREVPQREDLHREVMSLYAASGERDKVMVQYQVLYDTLQRTLRITPSQTTRTLYQRLIGEGRA